MPDTNINFNSSKFLRNNFISHRRGRNYKNTKTTLRIIDSNHFNRYLIDSFRITGPNINQNQNYDNPNYNPYVPNQPSLVQGGGSETAASIDLDEAVAEFGLDVITREFFFCTFLLNIFF